jgi:uncharacterized repeat protein (TIGR01451 family)
LELTSDFRTSERTETTLNKIQKNGALIQLATRLRVTGCGRLKAVMIPKLFLGERNAFMKFNKNFIRSIFTLAFAGLFAASSLFFNSASASMQSGSNTIVFDQYVTELGYTKIFVMNADGSNVLDLGRGYAPSWSGDGSKIAFVLGNGETSDIWTMNADGTNRQQLTYNWNSYAPAWSPDGSKVAFASYHESGANNLYMIDANGQNQVKLNIVAPELIGRYAPSWSADSSKIVFLGEKVVNGLLRGDYYQADSNNSGATTQITHLNNLFDRVPAAVSADGSRIVIEYQHDLQTYLTDGSGTMANLTDGVTVAVERPDYAPGGSKIVYTQGKTLTIMDADGGNKVGLDVLGRNPDWNPTAVISTPTPTPTPTATPAIEADFEVAANVSSTNVTVGSGVTYTINVKNLGGDNATGVSLASPFPAALTLTNLQSSQGSCSVASNQLSCQLGSLAANGQATITVVATVNTIGFASLAPQGSAIETDPDQTNNSTSVGVTATGPCAAPLTTPFEVTRSQWRRNDRDGQDELILTIRNRAGRSLDPRIIFVFDNLPQGVTIDPSVVAGYTQCSTPQGSPYLVAFAPNGREWKDMQTVSVRVLFNNPSRAGIPYNWRLYTGDVNP